MKNTAGKILPMPRGEYSSIATYNNIDIVRYDNSLWIAKKSNLKGIPPSKDNSEFWMLAIEESDVGELRSTITEMQSKIEELEEQINAYHDTNTSETVMLDIGEVTEDSIIVAQIGNESYSVENAETPQQVDNETYSFIINH